MSEPSVERTARVETDLYEIAIHIGRDNPNVAMRFLEAAEATFNQLAAMPEMGRRRKFKNLRLAGLRSWRVEGFSNYLIFYRPTAEGIHVLRVLHGAQDLDKLFAEE